MAKQGNWNKSFWKNLDNLGQNKIEKIKMVMLREAGITESVLQDNTPIRYGGLKSSIYSVVVDTPHGVSVRVGYTQTPHWDLDPANPHQNDFTNPELMSFLNSGNNSVSNEVNVIKEELNDFQDRIRTKVIEAFMDGGKK